MDLLALSIAWFNVQSCGTCRMCGLVVRVVDRAVVVDSTDLDDFVSVTGSSSSIIVQMDRAVDVDSTGYLDDLEFDDLFHHHQLAIHVR